MSEHLCTQTQAIWSDVTTVILVSLCFFPEESSQVENTIYLHKAPKVRLPGEPQPSKFSLIF